jgi:hypothetical protein
VNTNQNQAIDPVMTLRDLMGNAAQGPADVVVVE